MADEIAKHKELINELKQLSPVLYGLVENAKFTNIKTLNNWLESVIISLKDITYSFEKISNPKVYSGALNKIRKELDGFIGQYLSKATSDEFGDDE